ncbi:MAG: cbb3-type cytochrome c oxidase subunit I, partial [Planctomycetes bacterium]|nr:cbb3-type cytochrome c oxidase subunit I [Planctomycetota bacterium]
MSELATEPTTEAATAAGPATDEAATLRMLQRTSGVQVRMALVCILVTVLGGAASALYYIPSVATALNDAGLRMTEMRPIHTAFASMWIFGASVAICYHWMATSHQGLSRGDLLRFRIHTVCWIVAGLGIFVTLLMGISSGREYLGFHPAFSAVLLFGWLCFAVNVLKRLRHGFWGQPIYIWFWTVGTLFFVYTFVEGHAYLMPEVFGSPIRDLQVQWKSCGTLVGSFNFLMYGSLTYVGEKLSGDKTYAQSPVAFWLFGVGCLNSFTNYVHHTYHLPQTETVKWVAFVVSMLEIVILIKLMMDLGKMIRGRGERAPFCGRGDWLKHAKYWTVAMLLTSIVISVPPLNTLIHGTQLVMGHAMGATVGIDTLVLLGTSSWLICELRSGAVRQHLDAPLTKRSLQIISFALAALVI